MEEFKDLENLWKESATKIPTKKIDLSKIKNNRMKLKTTYTKGAALLVIIGIIVLALMSALDSEIKSTLVVTTMVVITAICFLQAILMFYTAKKIDRIDEAETPANHLKQWLNFREFQKKVQHWNMPVYYIALSITLGIYMYELLKNADLWKMLLTFAVSYSWMLFAYFYLGKKEMKKQDEKMNNIIGELQALESQFKV